MNLLRKFVEMGETKQEIGRIAFATDPSALPEPSVGLAWHPATSFNAADELIANPRLKTVFEEALRQGCAFTRPIP